MKALLLAAGFGTRLKPLTEQLPKPVWPFFDVPLAAHVLHALRLCGVRQVVINLHHLPDVLRQGLLPWIPEGLEVHWSPEEHILGTGGALAPWKDFFADDTFIVANADTYQEVDLARMLARHRATGALATLSLRPLSRGSEAPIEIDAEGRIVRFLGACAPGKAGGEPCDFSGIHLLEPEILTYLGPGPSCINADLHVPLVRQGAFLNGYLAAPSSFWSDLGTPQRYMNAHRILLEAGRVPPLGGGRMVGDRPHVLAGGGVVLPPSYLGRNVTITEGATVGPFAVIGGESVVGRSASVRSSILWPGCRVGNAQDLNGEIRAPDGSRILIR